MAEEFKILESNELLRGKQFGVVRDKIQAPDGSVLQRDSVTHPGAAVFLPVTQLGTFLLVRQYRHAVRRMLLECPAGTLNSGEDPLTCAQREIREEVGVAASEWVALGTILPAPGFCNEVQHLFVARGLRPEKAKPDDDEFISVEELSVAALRTAIQSGDVCDGKSLALLMRASILGILKL
ncbi:MAG: NUDIX hydrolase [Oligoflexia bacterium]|nr:NUDIX hydrolase [Oligoflexia bacterium]